MSSTPAHRVPRFRSDTLASNLPHALRSLRRAKRLSLHEVARATSISASFLSLVENGRSDITIGRLVRLVEFYGVTLADLIPMNGNPAEAEIVRASERRHVSSPDEGIDFRMLAPDRERTMMPMLLEFEPGARLAEPGRHEGEEWLFVLEGQLKLTLGEREPYHLDAGDSAYYRADVPHLFRNPDDGASLRIICVDSKAIL